MLVLAALGFIAFLGFAALVIDVGMAYSVQRYEHSTADSAALAGAQQLYAAGTRSLGPYDRACNKALEDVYGVLLPGRPAPLCTDARLAAWFTLPGSLVRYPIPGTPYRVSIEAPVPPGLCVTCDPASSVLVSIVRPRLPTFFSQIFGQTGWSPGRASVAGARFASSFAIEALQYPGFPTECADIILNGSGTTVHVINGDVGTNTGVKNGGVNGQGKYLLDPGFKLRQYDSTTVCPPPFPALSQQLSSRIADPNYTYPTRTGAPAYPNGAAGQDNANCLAERAKVPSQYTVGNKAINPNSPNHMKPADVTCYKPGIYRQDPGFPQQNSKAVLLEPGVYFFDRGLVAKMGALVGGYAANRPGVSLVFPATGGSFTVSNGPLLALNGGTKFLNPAGQEPTAAVGFDGALIQTSGLTPATPITLMVSKGVAISNEITIAGNSALYIGGVQYAPQDNVTITGSSNGQGYVGMIIGWTISYSGGTTITETGPPATTHGIMRLDAACSGAQQINPLCFP